jgi:A/G-specific adenine glycosylase
MNWQAFEPERPNRLQAALLRWYAGNRRDLPWRREPEPYAVWIAEIMLQQTQVARVVGYFRRWMDRFPDVLALARAQEDEVLPLWEGLGYYARARNALKTARIIRDEHGGRFPRDYRTLCALPGIGPYTAGAILSQACGLGYPAVDANAKRVLCRVFDVDQPADRQGTQRRLQELARGLIPPGRAGELNQALMELGALVCQPRAPRCTGCPLMDHCLARVRGCVELRPLRAGGKGTKHLDCVIGACLAGGRTLLRRRPEDGVWGGLWEFPGGSLHSGEDPEQGLARAFQADAGLEIGGLEHLATIRHAYTNHRLRLFCYVCRPRGEEDAGAVLEGCSWVEPRRLRSLALPAPHRRLADQLAASGWIPGEGK